MNPYVGLAITSTVAEFEAARATPNEYTYHVPGGVLKECLVFLYIRRTLLEYN